MLVAIVLFGVAAIGGVIMAGMRFRGRELPPLALALGHGLLAASALVVLLITMFTSVTIALEWYVALGGFLVAALGGFTLFSFHIRKRALPIPLVGVHGLVAVASFVVLLFGFAARM